jgi:glucose/arabinose dehydrogenase
MPSSNHPLSHAIPSLPPVILSAAKNLVPRADAYSSFSRQDNARGTRFFAALRMTKDGGFAHPRHVARFVAVSLWVALLAIGLLGVSSQTSQAARKQSPVMASLAQPLPEGESLPPGVRIETVLGRMDRPVAMAFDPQGRLFYTEKTTGQVRLFANGNLQANPVITFSVNANFERGLLGIAIDPNFNTNHYIYVYHTCADFGECPKQNRVVRFTENNGVGSSPTTIFTATQTAGNHVGGNIHFGPDGKLYVTVGDNATWENGQDLTARNAKLHRINPDGTAPADNPRFAEEALPSIYAYGLRNSFDFTFDPLAPATRPRIFASENGPGCDDEMNRIEPGHNYGWRSSYPCDDPSPSPEFNTIPPLWYTGPGQCCIAPTGIEVYDGDQIPQWKNHLFMANYNPGSLYHFYLTEDRNWVASYKRVEGVTANMDIETGPDGALYYLEGGGYVEGTLKRIVGPGAPPAATPTAATTPQAQVTPGPGASPTIPGNGSRTFSETGKLVTGIFLEYWDKNGGLPQQGYPISGLMNEVSDLNGKTYTVQYFERAVFEHHPENQPPYNVLLSQLGTFQYRQKYPNGAPNQQSNTSQGSMLFPETGKRVGGKFLDYWQKNGGLAQQGYPISEEFTEVSDLDGKPYTVQYFERAVFELHPENQPPFDVLLSQLGTFQYRQKYGGR